MRKHLQHFLLNLKKKIPPTVITKGGNNFLCWFESTIAQLQVSKTKKKKKNGVNLVYGV